MTQLTPKTPDSSPEWKGDPGKILGYIGIAWLPDGSKNVCIMPLAKILERRQGVFSRFKEYTSFGKTKTVADQIASSTWTLHPEEMMIKTGIHYQMKRLPIDKYARLREYAEQEEERVMKDVTPKSAPPKALPPKKPATPPAQPATKSDQESKSPAQTAQNCHDRRSSGGRGGSGRWRWEWRTCARFLRHRRIKVAEVAIHALLLHRHSHRNNKIGRGQDNLAHATHPNQRIKQWISKRNSNAR